jgi:hypothetical protein
MQKIDGLTIFNDIFVAASVSREKLASAISQYFQIPYTNIFFEGEGTENWSDDRASAFVYGYDSGDISWKLDIIANSFPDVEGRLREFAAHIGTSVFYDRRSQQHDSRVDVFDPDCTHDAAELVAQEDDSGDISLLVRRIGKSA